MFCRHFLGGSSEECNQGTCGTTDTEFHPFKQHECGVAYGYSVQSFSTRGAAQLHSLVFRWSAKDKECTQIKNAVTLHYVDTVGRQKGLTSENSFVPAVRVFAERSAICCLWNRLPIFVKCLSAKAVYERSLQLPVVSEQKYAAACELHALACS